MSAKTLELERKGTYSAMKPPGGSAQGLSHGVPHPGGYPRADIPPAGATLCRAVSCCAMLCHSVPCCAVLCRAVPCCAAGAAQPNAALHEAVLSALIDGMVQKEINSQAFAGGESGGVSILKILNECASARRVAADTSLQPALPVLLLAGLRHNLAASY